MPGMAHLWVQAAPQRIVKPEDGKVAAGFLDYCCYARDRPEQGLSYERELSAN